MKASWLIILLSSGALFGCSGNLKNDLDPVKVACGDGLDDPDRNLIAFRLPEGKLADFYQVAYSMLDGTGEQNGVSETGCLSVSKEFSGLILARNGDGSKAANYRINAAGSSSGLAIVSLSNNNLDRNLWDRCGARGLQRIQGSQILFKIYKNGKNFFEAHEIAFTNDLGVMDLDVSERGCFALTPSELKQGVSLQASDGTARKISTQAMDIFSQTGLQPVYFCSPHQYWDPTRLACVNSRLEKVSDLFADESNRKALEALTDLGCKTSIEAGVTFCPEPADFNGMDALYTALVNASVAVSNDKKMAYFPETKESFNLTIQSIQRDMERGTLYRDASLRESRYRTQLGGLTGMTFDSVVSLSFTQRFQAFENMLAFVRNLENLALLHQSGILNVLFYDMNSRLPPDSAYLKFDNTEAELKAFLQKIINGN